MTKAAFTRNNKILLSQLHYCRFLYYFIKNSRTLLVKERTVEKLKIIVYKHIMKLVKQLGDERELAAVERIGVVHAKSTVQIDTDNDARVRGQIREGISELYQTHF